MGYDRGDSFPFDFELNGIPFGSKSPNSTVTSRNRDDTEVCSPPSFSDTFLLLILSTFYLSDLGETCCTCSLYKYFERLFTFFPKFEIFFGKTSIL